MPRKTLTDKGVAALKPRAARYAVPDPELRGHYVRLQPTGAKSFVAVTVDPHGKQTWATIGSADVLTITEARERAREAIKRIKDGKPAFEAPRAKAATFEEITEQWLTRHVRAKGLRSEGEVTRLLKAHVYSAWKGRAFLSIRRSDVAALLDEVEDDHGARQADYVLAIVRGIANWYATRHDDYVPPIVRGMRRTSPKERTRSRILDDAELREIWRAAEANGTFGAFVRLLLLTAQRRRKVAAMRWDEIQVDGTWAIPKADREKGTAGDLVLPDVALDIIRAQPRLGANPYVLAGRANGHIGGWSKPKAAFDAKLKGVAPYVLHDLRRVARSLMARAGVRPEIAERVLGHAMQGVEGVYDRHSYRDEKADALQRLAALIAEIIGTPTAKKVVRLRPGAVMSPDEFASMRRALRARRVRRKKYFDGEFAKFEKAFAGGTRLWALFDAVRMCHINKLPLPDWAALGVCNVILERHRLPGNERRPGANPLARANREYADYRRWYVLEWELRKHALPPEPKRTAGAPQKGERSLYREIYANVEKQLRGEVGKGTIADIRRSHERVARSLAAGETQYLVFEGE